jgi:AhpD family alkylhydroperoxidase
MKSKTLLFAVVLALGAVPALADQKADAKAAISDIQTTLGFVPDFLRSLPEAALPGAWEEMKTLEMSTTSAIPPKYKELIGLAVAAQVPCKYCIVAHTEFARANGAKPEEIGLAVAEAGLTRHWSTYFHGTQMDETKFRAELTQMLDKQKAKDPAAPAVEPIEITDAQSAYDDAQQRFGMVPEFLKTFPANAVPGAWKSMRDVEMNANGAIPPKYINLISLAVAAQIPCDSCVVAGTEIAKSNGATDEEINEAVAMGAFTTHMSTLLNGLQVNEQKFKSDVARMTRPKKVAKR